MDLKSLIESEGWTILETPEGTHKIQAYGQEFKLTHPLSIHLKLYKDSNNPDTKFYHMKKAKDYLWPDDVWHYWAERRFRAHCEGYSYITYAGGASTSKSYTAAQIALLFWLAAPDKRGVIIASTTLEALNSRIWGYVLKFVKASKIPLPCRYIKSPNHKLLYSPPTVGKARDNANITDTIHGMFAIAAKKGDDDEAISSWIGRHPTDGMMLVLDEATDMPLSILRALPNLEAKSENFQCLAIGNSLSKYDLHGTLSTPLDGWDSVDPLKDTKWKTTQKNGICLFFGCYESPAIHEPDETVRKACSKFLITEEEVRDKEIELGKESDGFWRFVLGFWRKSSSSDVVIDPGYIDRYSVRSSVTWSGTHPLNIVGGLDLSFTSGGDNCILRLAYLGVDITGKVVLDFRGGKLLFKIPINAKDDTPAELQIVDKVIDLLRNNYCDISNIAIDCSGAGRMFPETLKLRMGTTKDPIKVLSSVGRSGKGEIDPEGWLVKNAYDLWLEFKPFMENFQIRGLDAETTFQLTNRLVKINEQKKVTLENKFEYKKRIGNVIRSQGKSPDEADGASLALQAAIHRFGFTPGATMDINKSPYMDKLYTLSLEGKKIQETKVRENFNVKSGFTSGLETLNLKKLFW